MKRLIGTGLLCGVAFGALSLAAERNANACGEPPPPEDDDPKCFYDEATRTLHQIVPIVTVPTTQDATDCGCGHASVDDGLNEGAYVSRTEQISSSGAQATQFCATVSPSESTTQALAAAFPGQSLGISAFAGVAAGSNIPSGVRNFLAFEVQNVDPGLFLTQVLGGQIDITGGTATLNATHNFATTVEKCDICTSAADSADCATLFAWKDGTDTSGGDPDFARPCASEKVTTFIAREAGLEVESGGCDVSGATGSRAASFFALIAAALMLGRRRRR